MNAQELFDKVTKHLLTQKVRATGSNGLCKLRDDQGRSCAIGCLIPDNKYTPEMEEQWHNPIAILSSFIDINEENLELLHQLRDLHDHTEPKIWRHKLEQLAKRFNLSTENLIPEDLTNEEA